MSSWISAGTALLGVVVGSVATYLIQWAAYRRDRTERHHARIREAYAAWAGAILREADAIRNLLTLRESLPDEPSQQIPNEVQMHFLQSMKEMALAALDSTHKEQVAFCQVMLTDTDRDRVKQAHEIRMPIKQSATDAQADLSATIDAFTEIEQAFAARISEFLGNVAQALK